MYNYIKRNKKMIGFLAGFLGTALLTSRRTTTKKSNIVRPKADTLAGSGVYFGTSLNNSKAYVSNAMLLNINSSYSLLAGRNSYTGHPITDGFLHLVWGIEEDYKIKQIAYNDGKGKPTIGIGNYTFHADSGKFWFFCKYGYTLKQIKAKYGRPNQDDKEFCFSLIRNHFKLNKISDLWRQMDAIGFPYVTELAEALQDFYFNSGGPHGSKEQKQFILDLQKIKHLQGRALRVAMVKAYSKFRFGYLRRAAGWKQTTGIMGGWAKRTYLFSERILGDRSMEKIKADKVGNTLTVIRLVDNYQNM